MLISLKYILNNKYRWYYVRLEYFKSLNSLTKVKPFNRVPTRFQPCASGTP